MVDRNGIHVQKIHSSPSRTTPIWGQRKIAWDKLGPSQACIRTQLCAAAGVETCEESETQALFPENMEVAVEVHPSQSLQRNVSVQLS